MARAPRASSARTAWRATLLAEPRQPAWTAPSADHGMRGGAREEDRNAIRRLDDEGRAGKRGGERVAASDVGLAGGRRAHGHRVVAVHLVRPVDRRAVEADRAREAPREPGRRRLFAFGRVAAARERDDETLGRLARTHHRHTVANVLDPGHGGIVGESGTSGRAESGRLRSRVLRFVRCRPSKRPVKSRSFRSSGSKSTRSF